MDSQRTAGNGRVLRVGIICGGPSAERGISLNSARSLLDHIQGDDLEVRCYYIDRDLNAYAISPAQLYSNTPADFDFKLESLARGFSSLSSFAEHLAEAVDIVFPVIHGRFGEDGGIQKLLEKHNIPFVGTGSSECYRAFDKAELVEEKLLQEKSQADVKKRTFQLVSWCKQDFVVSMEFKICQKISELPAPLKEDFELFAPSSLQHEASMELRKQGFVTVPSVLVQGSTVDESELFKWFESNQLNPKSGKVVVKPAGAGSSIGVTVAYGVVDSLEKANNIISEGIDGKVIVEIFLEGGSEFTVIILDVGYGFDCHPVVLIPSEVELHFQGNVKEKDVIFNYRRKYLPTRQVAYHTPPRFPVDVIEKIREGASLLFRTLRLRDFARIDGWFLPSSSCTFSNLGGMFGKNKSGTILFTDINLISGMEQTSFLFQQASKVGFSHSNILRSIIHRACTRFPHLKTYSERTGHFQKRSNSLQVNVVGRKDKGIQKVFVLFGGDSSERQVSLISATNVWLNLRAFDDLDVTPWLLAPAIDLSSTEEAFDAGSRTVWTLPYSMLLRHTIEEVVDACIESIEPVRAAVTSQLRSQVVDDLMEGLKKHSWFTGFDIADEEPVKFSLDKWVKYAKKTQATVFLSVHGGIGEDGTLQSLLEDEGVPHTGPGVMASKICLDKVATSLSICHLADSGVLTIDKEVYAKEDLLNISAIKIWQDLIAKLQCETLCIKPARDGCSTGVARLRCAEDLAVYVNALEEGLLRIPPNSFSKAHGMIEMPNPPPKYLIFEPFIETDEIIVSSKIKGENAHQLKWKGQSRWVEVTVGVIGKRGSMHSLTPSVTVKESGDILTLEEKFQGGTGINLTPPPASIVSDIALERCKQRIELVANTLQLEGFSRIDAFLNVDNGEVLVIEVNTVPGMTPSTVLIHQALSEQPPMYPHRFFRTLLDLASERVL